MPRPKSNRFNRDNTEYLVLARAKKAGAALQPQGESWWLDKSREEFQIEVRRRHACLLNSRNPSDRSLGKAI